MGDLFAHLAHGFTVALSVQNILLCFVGCLLGTLIGVLPGIGPIATIAILLPMTFGFPPESALIMVAGIYYGAQYGSSTTAILMSIPGEASSTVTCLDGHEMAKRGRAGTALGIAAIGSFFAGTVATVFVAALAIPLTSVALSFGPAEYFSLMLMGLVFAAALARGSMFHALISIMVGVLLSTVGPDLMTAQLRMTFGVPQLADGFNFAILGMGLFGIGEILRNLEQSTSREVLKSTIGRLLPGREDLRRSFWPMVRGTALGGSLGILPGNGAVLGAFASYTIEKKVARNPKEFGYGAIEGVAGPESANNAGAQTSFIPLLTLGLPPNSVMAIMIGAMTIHGIVPGPQVINSNPELFWGLIASMWIGNLMLLVINLPMISIWVKLLTVPYRLLFPAIILFCCIGVYSLSGSTVDVLILAAFGLIGYTMWKFGFEPAPLLLGVVLGSRMEEALRQALIISRGDFSTFVTRPISAVLLTVTVFLILIVALPEIRKRREKIFVEEED
ncbi:tripartite tricarboxylate transporter permease [Chelativorans salis]|uniref:Tripartite tricarboxylate transporter permease n=1 Tax=Chelativorans salis TaxID=2978478 RepID=A0ABT2LUB4_9HYPH|nr:tripartite tricarboxylate transporter permease [Chelativorans sp. EGI FJ00035]MCT7378130.1 tripartite tricarboxylate transporter permease [Chelativorans sp. EGI FJ00035]